MTIGMLESQSKRLLVAVALALSGCAVGSSARLPDTSHIEVAFSPEAGSEALVLKAIGSATESVRLAGYTFTSPVILRALLNSHKHGVDVRVLIDDRGNHSAASLAAIRLVVGAGIRLRTIAAYAIHHDKYIVIDERHVETGSYNYSAAAARSNSENVLVVWNDRTVAAKFLAHWADRWAKGIDVEAADQFLADPMPRSTEFPRTPR